MVYGIHDDSTVWYTVYTMTQLYLDSCTCTVFWGVTKAATTLGTKSRTNGITVEIVMPTRAKCKMRFVGFQQLVHPCRKPRSSFSSFSGSSCVQLCFCTGSSYIASAPVLFLNFPVVSSAWHTLWYDNVTCWSREYVIYADRKV